LTVSVLDDLRRVERDVVKRMEELQPLVDEYAELERVAQRLGVSPSDSGSAAPPKATQPSSAQRARVTKKAAAKRPASKRSAQRSSSSARSASSRPRRAQAQPGERREQVLRHVIAQPGITVREIGHELQVDPTSLYRSVRELSAAGSIVKRGHNLHPA
jgi:hypothetical protein